MGMIESRKFGRLSFAYENEWADPRNVRLFVFGFGWQDGDFTVGLCLFGHAVFTHWADR